LLERSASEQAQPIRDALSQLQLAYVRLGGSAEEAAAGAKPAAGSTSGPGPGQTPPSPAAQPTGPAEPATDPSTPDGPGPAQRSGRLWVPGQ
jgi:hypothetical protein